MNTTVVCNSLLSQGLASRYVKPALYKSGIVQPSAFDLRGTVPPEEFVSFCLTNGASDDDRFIFARDFFKTRFSSPLKPKAVIAMLDIDECLDAVNDEGVAPVIAFDDRGLPHCGLVYLTNDLRAMVEAKTTLSLLATNKVREVSEIV